MDASGLTGLSKDIALELYHRRRRIALAISWIDLDPTTRIQFYSHRFPMRGMLIPPR